MAKKILITGGTGLVGSALIPALQALGHQVHVLGRTKREDTPYQMFEWDYKKEYIEEGAFEGVDTVIHLAGAGVADSKWTPQRKDEIYNSRTKTSLLLHKYLKEEEHQVKTFVAASAIGIYGMDTGNAMMKEGSPVGSDFLAHVTDAWEVATSKVESLGIRLVQLRVGVVLSNQGGALTEIIKPPILAPLGKGAQYMSWIHMDDLCQMFIAAIDSPQISGAFNAVGPSPVTNRDFTKQASMAFGKPYIPIAVPSIILKLILGDMAMIVLGGSKVSSAKIEETGFEFRFPKLAEALNSLAKEK